MKQEIIQAIQRLQAAQIAIMKYDHPDIDLSVDVQHDHINVWAISERGKRRVHKGFAFYFGIYDKWEPIGRSRAKYTTKTVLAKVSQIIGFDV